MFTTYFKSGSWNAICAVCGFQYKADELKQRWDGVYVCKEDWEPRNVLDFFTVREEDPTPPWIQDPLDTFLDTCDMFGRSAFAGYSVAGCMVAGLTPTLG